MPNRDNLISPQELNARLTPEQRRANASKAGKASVKAKRERKALREQLETILAMPCSLRDKSGRKLLEKYEKMGVTAAEVDNQMAMALELFLTAMGDSNLKIQAIKQIREITKDEEQLENEFKVNIKVLKAAEIEKN